MRAALPLVLILAACGGTTSDDDTTDDTGDTGVVIQDTFPEGDSGDTDAPINFDDTGAVFTIEVEGHADVSRSFEGFQAYSAKWISPDRELSKPRCIYVQDLLAWEEDPDREDIPNPIGTTEFEQCTDCLFRFTVTLKNARTVERYPWTEDSDTGDSAEPPADVVGGKLDCTSLVEKQGYITPADLQDQSDYVGFAYDPEDMDVSDGVIKVWLAQYSSWSTYAYTATFDDPTRTLRWVEALPPYQYVP